MTICGRMGALCAIVVLTSCCSHKGEGEAAKSADESQTPAGGVDEAQSVEEAQGQVGAEARTSDWEHITPPEEPPRDDVLNGARSYECSNGQRFTVEIEEDPAGATITKAGEEYWLPRVTKARFAGDEGEFRVTSPTRTSLALAGHGALRSCVRD
jgi:hypothetical protein